MKNLNWMRWIGIFITGIAISSITNAGQDLSCLTGPADQQLGCVRHEFEQSEQELNKTYERIVAELQEKQEFGNEKNFVFENMSSRLRISQRAWLYYRAGQCELESFAVINEQHVVPKQIACTTKLNLERTTELKKFFGKYLNKKF